jgi:hypothetical protein
MKSKREALIFRVAAAALWATVLIPGAANAGPPYRTDDPEPVDYKHWEFYTFTSGTHVNGGTSGVSAILNLWAALLSASSLQSRAMTM